MPFELPKLPWEKNALAPHLSEETIDFHYGKHHNAYVANLNKLIEGGPEAGKSLEELIKTTEGGVFNNAAQVWNHTFYWHSMKPGGGGRPSGALADAVNRDFGGFERLRAAFADAAATQFGSGWAWLVKGQDGKLRVVQTGNADCPIRGGDTPLLAIDVWEHAYYIDFRDARPRYIETFLARLANWDFAASNFGG